MKERGKTEVNYEFRMCLFLDILGFSDRVRKSANDTNQFTRIVKAINILRQHFSEDGAHISKRVTQFSDSVVVSYAIDERSGVFNLLYDVGLCLIRLMDHGFLMRGGIAVGNLLHTETHLFGPAMNDAYLLESKAANYPRVIVQEDLLLAARHAPASQHDAEHELKYVQSLLRRDFDGLLYIDYIRWDSVVSTFGGDNASYPAYLSAIAKLISENIFSGNPAIASKYGWVARHYMETKSQIERLDEHHPFNIENPGYVEKIRKLPSFPAPGEVEY